MGVMGDASNANDGKAFHSFPGWWLGGFGCAGAIVAGTLVAVFANLGFVESAGIAALGAIVGVVIGIRYGDGIGAAGRGTSWMGRRAPVSRIDRLYLRLDQLIDSISWLA